MTIVSNLDAIKKWLEDNVCQYIKFKKPDDDNPLDGYNYELVTPAVFVQYLPSKNFPNTAPPAPSICIQLEGGSDDIISRNGELNIRLGFSIWNPGMYKNINEKLNLNLNVEGWRDPWNFIDLALEKIENSEYIGGLRLIKENGINFAAISEQTNIPQFFPYWYAEIKFTLERSIVRTKESYRHLLD